MDIPNELIQPLIHLKKLLVIYVNTTKDCKELIQLLVQHIEELRGINRNNFFIETLIKEYNYPKSFSDIPETLELESFYLRR